MHEDFFTGLVNFIKDNRYAVTLAIAGGVLAVLFICVGFWQTLLIAALCCVGGYVGIKLDKRSKQKNDSLYGDE